MEICTTVRIRSRSPQPADDPHVTRSDSYVRVATVVGLTLAVSVTGFGLYLRHLESPTGLEPQQVRIAHGASARAIGSTRATVVPFGRNANGANSAIFKRRSPFLAGR